MKNNIKAKILINGKLRGIEEVFTNEDMKIAGEIAKIAIDQVEESKELEEKDYNSLVNLIQLQALEDLYKAKYK